MSINQERQIELLGLEQILQVKLEESRQGLEEAASWVAWAQGYIEEAIDALEDPNAKNKYPWWSKNAGDFMIDNRQSQYLNYDIQDAVDLLIQYNSSIADALEIAEALRDSGKERAKC